MLNINPYYIGNEEDKKDCPSFHIFELLSSGKPISKEHKDELFPLLVGVPYTDTPFGVILQTPKGCHDIDGWRFDFRGFPEIKRYLVRFKNGIIWHEYWSLDYPSIKRYFKEDEIEEKIEHKKKFT